MSDFKNLIKVKTVSAQQKVSLFHVRVLFQKGEGVDDKFHLKCPCNTKKNNGYQCKGIKKHAKLPTHATFRNDLQVAFDNEGIYGVIQLMKRNHFWSHEYTVNSKKAIYITFRVRVKPTLALLATVKITSLDPNFEFDYKGSVPHEVIAKMEESCSLLDSCQGIKEEDAYFCASVARNELLHWCCGGMTQATSSSTSAIARNAMQEEHEEEQPQDDDEEESEEEPEEVPQEEPRSNVGESEAEQLMRLVRGIQPPTGSLRDEVREAMMAITNPQHENLSPEEQQRVTLKFQRNLLNIQSLLPEPHVDEATSSTTDQASIADRVKARSEQKQLEAEEERERRKIVCDEITDTKIRDNLSERKLLQKSLNFQKALEIIEKEEEDM